MKEINLSVYDRINVVLDIFRVGSYDRAVVMIVGFGKFIPFIWNTRIEDRLNAIVDQPLYMSVCQLRRITLGFTRDGINTEFINASCRSRREFDRESKLIEKCEPERIVFVYI